VLTPSPTPSGLLVPIIIPAEGAILERALETAHLISSGGLSRHAYGQYDAAQMRTTWGRRHQRRFALAEGGDVLASAIQYDLLPTQRLAPTRLPPRATDYSQTIKRLRAHQNV
jgi:hypothetical protein